MTGGPRPPFVCGVREFAAGRICKWPIQDLTYSIVGYLSEFSREEYEAIVRNAFDAWEKVCGLRAEFTKSTDANIIVGALRGPRNNFDGPGGVLAWCELPCSKSVRQVKLMMDIDENWSASKTQGSILVGNVLKHEIGHALGLDHIQSGKALMNATYDPQVTDPLALDVKEAVLRMGKARPRTQPVPPPADPSGKKRVEIFIDGVREGQWLV